MDVLQTQWNEFRQNPPLTWWTGLLVGLVLAALLIGAFLNTRVFYLAVGVFLAFPTVMVFARFPQAWILGVVAMHAVWLRTGDKGLSLVEVGIVGFFFGSLFLWFLWHLAVKRRRLVRHVGDFLILSAYGLSLINLGVAMYNGVEAIDWFRPWLLWLMILYYFPIREFITTDRRLRIFLYIALGVFCVVGVQTVQSYIRATTDVVYAFELVSARSALTEMALVGATIGCAGALLYARRWISNIVCLGLTVFFFSCLVATFSRTFWVATVLGLGLIFIFAHAKQRAKILAMSSIGMVIGVIGIVTFVGEDKSELFLTMLQNRVESIFVPTESISLESRGSETQRVFQLIPQSPFLGLGFGKTFMFYDPIYNTFKSGAFVHNGYLFLTLYLGIPTAFLFLAGIISYVFRTIPLFRKVKDPLLRYTLLVAFASLCSTLFVSFFGNQFAFREGVFLFAVSIGLISMVEQRVLGDQSGRSAFETFKHIVTPKRRHALIASESASAPATKST